MDKEGEFAQYVSALSETLAHADRVGPMAALVAPQRAGARGDRGDRGVDCG